MYSQSLVLVESTRMKQTDYTKMIFLIRRREGVSRDELIMHWFKNHMPAVIESNRAVFKRNGSGASKYIAQLFKSVAGAQSAWDGMAQLWYREPLPPMKQAAGSRPSDTFQQKAEPYWNWATKEYVVCEGSDQLPVDPLVLNDPYPMTRSGFLRLNYLVAVKPNIDYTEFFEHWLNVHVPNVESHLAQAGGFRYVVSHSVYPDSAPYAGMAELYFETSEGAQYFQTHIRPDGMERWIDASRTHVMRGDTEMVGIP